MDEHGAVRACGESLAGLLGRDAEDIVGQPVWTFLPGWSPYDGMGRQSRLRLAASRTTLPVCVCGEALHLPGETLFVLEVRRLWDFAQPGAAEAVMATDRRGEIRYVNLVFEAMTGYSNAEVAGLTPALLKSGAHDSRVYRELWDTLRDGQVYRGMLVNRRKNGELYHEDKVIRPVPDRQGRPALFLSSGRDVTPWVGQTAAFQDSRVAL